MARTVLDCEDNIRRFFRRYPKAERLQKTMGYTGFAQD
ncbi:MAG: hypothetical protein BLITH_0496 [Brockia lithotrophica]|uniref:Uncharacterized protein n=1 Tax=Brockia lithotrophica TaxID=933949 RepID=A0A2T5GB55_9BACL|nr:MAG: hypothetical protein BLITH_0496 [Brockia lithotrophica]